MNDNESDGNPVFDFEKVSWFESEGNVLINEFLWTNMPESMTLGRLERLSIKIFDLIKEEIEGRQSERIHL